MLRGAFPTDGDGIEAQRREGKQMAANRVESFRRERERLNALVLEHADLSVKRFYNLDGAAYRPGALPAKTKELLGLAASLVLRCDDCVLHHMIRCHEEGASEAELKETVAIGLVVGGSITIPHVRRLWEAWETLAATPRRPPRPSTRGGAADRSARRSRRSSSSRAARAR